MWEHTTLRGEVLSFTRYPVELDRGGCDTVIALHLFTCGSFFPLFFGHSTTLSLCALHLTPNI